MAKINFSVYTCPPIPTVTRALDLSSYDADVWSPFSCTLIFTLKSAILVDCPASVAATNDLATWIKSTLPAYCTLTHLIASHAHGDHLMGYPILKNEFPCLKAFASKQVVEEMVLQYRDACDIWRQWFPATTTDIGLPESIAGFQALPAHNIMTLDGYEVAVHDVPYGDTHTNSFVHVPGLRLVVAGDIVYNGDCHQNLGEANTKAKRALWIKALSQIRALKPSIIIPGHTFVPPAESNEALAASMLEGTEEYICGFEKEQQAAEDAENLFARMKTRYPGRRNLFILEWGCMAAFSN